MNMRLNFETLANNIRRICVKNQPQVGLLMSGGADSRVLGTMASAL